MPLISHLSTVPLPKSSQKIICICHLFSAVTVTAGDRRAGAGPEPMQVVQGACAKHHYFSWVRLCRLPPQADFVLPRKEIDLGPASPLARILHSLPETQVCSGTAWPKALMPHIQVAASPILCSPHSAHYTLSAPLQLQRPAEPGPQPFPVPPGPACNPGSSNQSGRGRWVNSLEQCFPNF